MIKIGFLLGTFDPIHIGHLNMIRLALLHLDKVIVVPTVLNPCKESSTIIDHRMNMILHAIKPFGTKCAFSKVELTLNPPYYSVNTLKALKEVYQHSDNYLIVGDDVDVESWNESNWILDNYKLMVIHRGINTMRDCTIQVFNNPMPVSSTYIRECIKREEPIFPLVPESVNNYIKTHKLYENISN